MTAPGLSSADRCFDADPDIVVVLLEHGSSLLPQNHGLWLASDLVCEPPSEKSGDLRVADVNAARVIELPLNGVATDAWATMGLASGAIHERRMLPP